MGTVINTVNLTKFYGADKGIENVNLSVEEGEIFGFIGPNGSGKSTTIRTLLGLIKPTSGSATIFGKDIITDGPAIRQDIGYLPSEVFYYDNMRVTDLLRYSASFYKKPRVDMDMRIKKLADMLDLDVSRKIDDLSYGNKKKVGIIQGLLHNPKLIILDEPTGGLDPLMQQTFFDLLKTENQRGATILFSSHILSEVQKMCDRVAIIKEGELIKVEKMADLRGNNYIRCRLETAGPVNPQLFRIKGISDLQHHANTITFLYRGDVNVITRLLVSLKLKSAWVEEPELEEVFMHYYQREE